jgi:SET domain-containing protein
VKPNSAPGIRAGKSAINGKGCFATIAFRKRRKIGEYVGERISRNEVIKRVSGQERIYICGLDAYWSIDGSVGGNATQYVNHSCEPNCFLQLIRGHLVFFALRDIEAGEEIVCDYGDSYHSDDTRCSCRAPSCRGTINRPRR